MPLYLVSNIYVENPVSYKFPATFPYRTHYDWKGKFAFRGVVNAANPKNAYKRVERQFKIVVHTKKRNVESAFLRSDLHPTVVESAFLRSDLHPTVCIRPISFIHNDFVSWWSVITKRVKPAEYAAFVLNPVQYKLTPYTRLSGRAGLVLNCIRHITRTTDLTWEDKVKAINEMLKEPPHGAAGSDRINTILDKGKDAGTDKNESQILESYLSKPHYGTCCNRALTCLRCYAETVFVLPETRIHFADMAKAFKSIHPKGKARAKKESR